MMLCKKFYNCIILGCIIKLHIITVFVLVETLKVIEYTTTQSTMAVHCELKNKRDVTKINIVILSVQ